MVIEAALILPVFVVLLFGIVEMSLMMFNKHVITAAAREAARQGVLYVEGTQRTADADIISSAQTILDNLPAHTFQDSDQEIQVVREGFDHGDTARGHGVSVLRPSDHIQFWNPPSKHTEQSHHGNGVGRCVR